MALSDASRLYIFELVFYALLLPFVIFLGWRHGRHGILGYFYLNAYCAVRVVADIIELLPANRDATHPTISTAVLSSIGLSPLLLGLSGFLHEAHVYLVHASCRGRKEQEAQTRRWLWLIQIQAHVISGLGMVLLIIGSIRLAEDTDSKSIKTAQTLRKVGAIVLLALWAALALYALFLARLNRRNASRGDTINCLAPLIGCIIASTPFIAVRCIYSVIYVFDSSSTTLNPLTGALWVKVIFVVLAPLAAVVCLCAGGWVSRYIKKAALYDAVPGGVQLTTVGHKASGHISENA